MLINNPASCNVFAVVSCSMYWLVLSVLTSKMFSAYENIDHRDFIRDNHWLPQITQHINSYFPWWPLSDPYHVSDTDLSVTWSPLPQEYQAPAQPLVPYGKPPQEKLWKGPNKKTNWGVPFSGGPRISVIAKERSFHLKITLQSQVSSWSHLIPHFVMFHYFICLCTLRYTSLADPQREFLKG